jgi:hypothetical protein
VAIEIQLPLTSIEKDQLAAILDTDSHGLDQAFVGYATAAAEEYARMILGQRVFTRGSDLREYRLLLLIKHVFPNNLPDDQTVSDLFQTTLSESRSLSKSVTAKFQYDLAGAKEATLKRVLAAAQQNGNEWLLTINSRTLVEQLNRDLAQMGAQLPPIRVKENTVSTFVAAASSYDKLKERYP